MKQCRKRVSPNTPRPLNEQQQQFVVNILSGMAPGQAAATAGYCAGHGPTYTAEKAASVLLAKPHIASAIAQGALGKAKENGALSGQWLKDKLAEGIVRPMKASQVQCLLAACRTIPGFFRDTEEPQPAAADDPKPKQLDDTELEQRITGLMASLGYSKPSNEERAITAPAKPPASPEQQTPRTDVPEPPQRAIAARPALNMAPQSPDERQSVCPQHGPYLSTRNRAGHWSYCGKCVKAWNDNEKWLASLMPMGGGN